VIWWLKPALLCALPFGAISFFGPRLNAAMLAEVRAAGGKEVKHSMMNRAVLVLALCAGCAVEPGGGESLLPGGMRGRTPVPGDDAGADVLALIDGPALAADAPPALMPDAAPVLPDAMAPDAAAVYPTCAAIGYDEKSGLLDCDVPRRTGDQRYSCYLCAGGPPAQSCESKTPHPGDIPALCVRSCAECVQIRCTADCCYKPFGAPLCPVVDGGAP
jgi:hypothetical protein